MKLRIPPWRIRRDDPKQPAIADLAERSARQTDRTERALDDHRNALAALDAAAADVREAAKP